MPTKRRRPHKPRHRFDPRGWIPPEVLTICARALIGTGVAGAATAPALLVRQEQASKAEATNDATNAALGTAAALQESLAVFRQQFSEFEVEMKETRRRERDVRARLPESAVGPLPPPPRRHWWSR